MLHTSVGKEADLEGLQKKKRNSCNERNIEMINRKWKESVSLRVIVIIITLFVAGNSTGLHKTAIAQTTNKPAQAVQTPPEPAQDNYSADLGKGIGMDMILIPAGSFLMGSPASEPGRFDREEPQTKVSLEGFWMGKYEVTQAQYDAIMGTNISWFKGANNPVENVSWNDAMEFCRKLSQRTGQQYTLPTEAQWEYACRAGTTTAYSFGNDASQLGNYAWWYKNSGNTTHPVGQKQPNAYGMYDMHGNVWEWCLSMYKPYPYSETDGRNSLSDKTSGRVQRGGSWNGGNPGLFRCAFRSFNGPDLSFLDYYGRSIDYGFRCARTP